jgi:hypothetical protein
MNTLHIRAFNADELGLAMGRPNMIHAAVLRGPAGKSFLESAVRLIRYDGVAPDMESGIGACSAMTKTGRNGEN